jgi:regulatory protein
MAKKEKNILRDIMQYCAKAEHCTQDVVFKLRSWNVEEEEVESILERLQSENFLNDARYAKAYVNDKWKLDHWGKKKIRHQLFLKNIDDKLLEGPLSAIDEEEYKSELASQLLKKESELPGNDPQQLVTKLYNFAVSRGFEEELIMQWIQLRKNKPF